jgi:toxin secretion/phage lysis holin
MDVKCVDNFYLQGYEVKAIQELHKMVRSQQEEIKKLKNEISEKNRSRTILPRFFYKKEKGGQAMKTNITVTKAAVTAAASLLLSRFGALCVPILLMVACNVMDYVTGLMAVPSRKASGASEGVSSYESVRGIFKKVSMWILVGVGAVIDQLLLYTGFTTPFKFLVASVVAVWITCNELISILENIVDIGVSVPAFLLPLVKNIKSQIGNVTGTEEKESEEEE